MKGNRVDQLAAAPALAKGDYSNTKCSRFREPAMQRCDSTAWPKLVRNAPSLTLTYSDWALFFYDVPLHAIRAPQRHTYSKPFRDSNGPLDGCTTNDIYLVRALVEHANAPIPLRCKATPTRCLLHRVSIHPV